MWKLPRHPSRSLKYFSQLLDFFKAYHIVKLAYVLVIEYIVSNSIHILHNFFNDLQTFKMLVIIVRVPRGNTLKKIV
jgi:hypothetical protein